MRGAGASSLLASPQGTFAPSSTTQKVTPRIQTPTSLLPLPFDDHQYSLHLVEISAALLEAMACKYSPSPRRVVPSSSPTLVPASDFLIVSIFQYQSSPAASRAHLDPSEAFGSTHSSRGRSYGASVSFPKPPRCPSSWPMAVIKNSIHSIKRSCVGPGNLL